MHTAAFPAHWIIINHIRMANVIHSQKIVHRNIKNRRNFFQIGNRKQSAQCRLLRRYGRKEYRSASRAGAGRIPLNENDEPFLKNFKRSLNSTILLPPFTGHFRVWNSGISPAAEYCVSVDSPSSWFHSLYTPVPALFRWQEKQSKPLCFAGFLFM